MYRECLIGGPPELNKFVAIEESLFLHDNNRRIWIVEAIETDCRKMRFNIINGRTADNIKKFLLNHVEAGTEIISDGWLGNSFLDGEESVLEYEPYPWDGDFGNGLSSTSHMEHTWSYFKNEKKPMYNYIPFIIFLLYLREAEYSLRLSKKKIL